MVGAVGFEPTTSCSQGRHANQAALRPDGTMTCRKFFLYTKFSSPLQAFLSPISFFHELLFFHLTAQSFFGIKAPR